MWLRDQLPCDFPSVRVITYGYDTKIIGSESFQHIDDLARSLISHLKSIGRAEYSAKPLMILAHSLGGIVVKRALYYLLGSGEAETFMLEQIKLLLFFGVPNKGMHIKHLLAMVHGQPNEPLVRSLSTESDYLHELDMKFSGIVTYKAIRIISAYETRLSLTAVVSPSKISAPHTDPLYYWYIEAVFGQLETKRSSRNSCNKRIRNSIRLTRSARYFLYRPGSLQYRQVLSR
jgi:hypothetical protein